MKNKIRAVVLSFLLISLSQLSQGGDGACQALFVTGRDQILEKVRGSEFLLLRDYQGQGGYLRFVEELNTPINMQYAFDIVSQYLSKKQRQELGWQGFNGPTTDYRELKEKIVDKAGKIRTEFRTEYFGMEGCALFADREYKREYSAGEYAGDMKKAYVNISAILDKKQFQELGWQQFQGLTTDYRELKEKIVDKAGKIRTEFRTEYFGMEGYALFADREYKREYSAGEYAGDMEKAYKNISAILDKKQFEELGWQKFQGLTKEYRELKEKIVDKEDQIRTEYLGMEGYAVFADRHYNGNMEKAYVNISAILDKKQFEELGWQQFHGSTTEYRELKEKIVDKEDQIRTEYFGMEGYAVFADKEYNGAMEKAYKNISAILDKKQRQELGWQQFQGLTKEYRELKEKIVDKEEDQIRTEYFGMEGYAVFADKEYNGAMEKAYVNISAILDKKQFQELGWQQFHGSTKEYRELKEKIVDKEDQKEDQIRTEYFGMEGYAVFADKEYNGAMEKAYVNISAILDKKQFQELGWQQFKGLTKEYRELKEKIVDKEDQKEDQIRTEYFGMEGYALFSDKEYDKDMQKAYVNISAILDKKQFQELGWQQFKGLTKEYRELKEKIVDKAGQIRTEYFGMEGYALFSDRYYAGNMQKAYINISAILGGVNRTRELGLGWKQFLGTVSQFYALKDLFDRYNVKQLKGHKGQEQVAREVFKGDRKRAYDNVSILREELLGNRKAFNELKWMRTGKRKIEN